MKKMRFGIGGMLMIAAMLVSDSFRVLGVYILAAILHEMGHILAAFALKIRIKEIILSFSGIRIVTDESLTSYRSELLLASAGPAVNIAIFFAVLCCFIPSGGFLQMMEAAGSFMAAETWNFYGAIGFFALSSAAQAAVNLLPVNSFDGGRIIYCIIARLLDERTASHILSVTTAVSAFLLWTIALYLMLRISAGLGIFVFAACIFAGTIGAREGIR